MKNVMILEKSRKTKRDVPFLEFDICKGDRTWSDSVFGRLWQLTLGELLEAFCRYGIFINNIMLYLLLCKNA